MELKIKWVSSSAAKSIELTFQHLFSVFLHKNAVEVQILLVCIDQDKNKQHLSKVRFWSRWLIFCSIESLSLSPPLQARGMQLKFSQSVALASPLFISFSAIYKAQYKFIEYTPIRIYHFRCAHRECFYFATPLLGRPSAKHRSV